MQEGRGGEGRKAIKEDQQVGGRGGRKAILLVLLYFTAIIPML